MDKNNPLISIITVVYNGEKNLENTILSVINQTYKNIEYIIIDGNSTDSTISIIKKYENKISYWETEPDKGIYDAMNKGIEKVKGEWINFMNAGDLFYSFDTVSEIVQHFTSTLNIVYGDTFIKYNDNLKNKYQKAKEYKFVKYNIPFCHQSVFVQSELMKKMKFDLSYRYSSDYDLFLKIFKNNLFKSKRVPIPISIYDMHGASNGIPAIKEYYLIAQKYYPYSWISIRHYFRFISVTTKLKIKSMLPENVVKRIIILKKHY